MDTKELRIGNYTDPGRIIEISENHIVFDDGFGKFNTKHIVDGLDHVKPIPITEQWLIDFGFKIAGFVKSIYSLNIDEKHYLAFDTSINKMALAINNLEIDTRYEVEELFIVLPEIKHVHQLQNLLYILTGNDLIYTPSK